MKVMTTAPASSALYILASAMAVSAAGDTSAVVALSLHLAHLGPWAVVGLLVLPAAASALLSGLAGNVSTHWGPPTVIIVAAIIQVFLYTMLAVVPPLPLIFLLVAADAVLSLIMYSATASLVPKLSSKEMAKAYGVTQAATTIGRLVGPVMGAGLYAVSGGPQLVLVVNAVTFLLLFVTGFYLRRLVPLSKSRDGSKEVRVSSKRARAFDHVRLLTSVGNIRISVITLLASILFTVIIDASLLFYSRDVLHVPSPAFAILLTAWSLGFLASTRVSLLESPIALVSVLLKATIVLGAAVVMDAALVIYWVSILIGLLGGGAHGLQNRTATIIIAVSCEGEKRPLAFAAFGATVNLISVSAFMLGGVVLQIAGPRAAVFLAGFGTLAIGIIGSIVSERQRRGIVNATE